ncbi:multiple sugar transport system substrate-binding protein [Promicromonospora umidemergens]|uniref:Extracellular solute-binding protein n=1 Tax=Promicromonospora umidemergens TaxID=629679 RepID=A0ABP8XN77_9MICO|nr:extracellular solute-binding protein [Promicromonospora umidemergens]MCP2281981.1 multiple sugar transport system substrate-binding protein [Promicromonospora umidemergens]
MHRRIRSSAVVVALTAVATLLGGCGGPAEQEEQGGSITFWTPQSTPERVAAQEAVAARFTEESGIEVDVVPLAAADQDQALVTGAASGEVPDVILAGASQITSWQAQGLLDTDVVQLAMDALDPTTFNQSALDAVTVQAEEGATEEGTEGGTVAAVPSDGWVHLIAYRTDLLEEAGVEVPTTVPELAEAATTVKEELDVTGIALGTQSGTASGTEGIESVFQSAGCQLVSDGEVTIDAPECTEAAQHFKELRDSSVAGDYDVESARAAYMAGDAAMLLFSTHILDELANLDEAVPPSCEQCADDPAFLAENSGFITVLKPSHGSSSGSAPSPAQFGATLAYAVPAHANSEEARQYIEYVMSEGYADTLAVATEGRLPLRTGTPESPTEYLDAWGGLGFGPKVESSVAEVYGDELVDAMGDGMAAVSRWGQGTPDATLAGLVATQGTLAQQLDPLYRGTAPAEVTEQMAAEVAVLQQVQ